MTQNFLHRYGPWAVVTGASDGIGEAFARQVAARGVNVVLVARRRDRLEKLAEDLQQQCKVQSLVVPLDLCGTDALAQLRSVIEPLDVGLLIACAGFGTSGLFVASSLPDELAMLCLNAKAVLEQTHSFARRFQERGRGGIVLLGSLVGWQGTPYAAHYAATKAYVQTFAEGLGVEMKRFGVDVLVSAPGPVHSGFAQRASMQMGIAAKPEAIAEASLRALGRATSVVPGFLSKLLTYSLAPLPRRARIRMMGVIMGSMARPRTDARE